MWTPADFPQGVLTTISLIGGVAGDGAARACAGCEALLPLCSVAVTACLRAYLLPSCWSGIPECQV